MVKVNDFIDFDAFKACRAFVRETGLLVRTPSFASKSKLGESNGASVDFDPFELR